MPSSLPQWQDLQVYCPHPWKVAQANLGKAFFYFGARRRFRDKRLSEKVEMVNISRWVLMHDRKAVLERYDLRSVQPRQALTRLPKYISKRHPSISVVFTSPMPSDATKLVIHIELQMRQCRPLTGLARHPPCTAFVVDTANTAWQTLTWVPLLARCSLASSSGCLA
jgi:hypothetical protein